MSQVALKLKKANGVMNSIIVDIADMKIAQNPGDELVTYSLGSCIGVAIYDPVVKVGGMIHCMLPLSKVDKEKASVKPYMFVDTGMMKFLKGLFELGVKKERATVKVAGGSRVLDKNGLFKIGERNYAIFRKILWKNGMMIDGEDIGGEKSRTIRLNIDTGRFTMKSAGVEVEL